MRLAAPEPLDFDGPADVLAVLGEQINAVRADAYADPGEKARHTRHALQRGAACVRGAGPGGTAGGRRAGFEIAEAVRAGGLSEETKEVAVTFHRRALRPFEPPERLTLVIEAMARDDAEEVRRLQQTCPKVTYTERDAEFTDRWTIAFDILAVVSIDLRCSGEAARTAVGHRGRAPAHPRGTTSPPRSPSSTASRCGKGLPQCQFFARPLPEPRGTTRTTSTSPTRKTRARGARTTKGSMATETKKGDPTRAADRPGGAAGRDREAVRALYRLRTAVLLDAMNDIAKDMVNIWAAFGGFCRTRLGVSPRR